MITKEWLDSMAKQISRDLTRSTTITVVNKQRHRSISIERSKTIVEMALYKFAQYAEALDDYMAKERAILEASKTNLLHTLKSVKWYEIKRKRYLMHSLAEVRFRIAQTEIVHSELKAIKPQDNGL